MERVWSGGRVRPSAALRLAVLAAGLALGACSGAPAQMPAATVKDDQFQPYAETGTATLRFGSAPDLLQVKLIGRRDRKTGAVTSLVRLQIAYFAYQARHYETARTEKAVLLPVQRIAGGTHACPKNGCTYVEEILVSVPLADLRAAASGVYRLKVFARTGQERLVTIPGSLISSLLIGLDGAQTAAR